MTRFPVIALRSVDLGTPDLDRSERFYVSVWGLDVVARHNGAVYLRASGSDHHVLALHHSTRPELHAVTVAQHRCRECGGPLPRSVKQGRA